MYSTQVTENHCHEEWHSSDSKFIPSAHGELTSIFDCTSYRWKNGHCTMLCE